MTDYQLTEPEEPCVVIRTEDSASIPPDPANRDYAEYLQWVEDGGVPDPYVPPEPVPGQPSADERLDMGIDAALAAAEEVRNKIRAIPTTFTTANYQKFLIQAKALSDAFVAMLEAQKTN
jgi:hypothetical protein